jgi:peptidoglycan/LPS O-acetylase OafA/YrhL
MFHFGEFAAVTRPEKILAGIFAWGASGVDLFFVLSGFLITGILIETKSSVNYFRTFYARRFLRILPLYSLVLLIFFHVLVPIAHSYHKWINMATNTEHWYWLYLANWPIGHHNSIQFLVPYWSLSVEEQFYLLWPLVVFSCSKRTLAYISCSVVALALVLRYWYTPIPGGIFVYVWTPFRMDGLALGALCALIYRDRSWSAVCNRWLTPVAAVAAVSIVVLSIRSGTDSGDAPSIQYTLLGVLYSCVVLRAAVRSQSGDAFCRLLTSKPLVRLGTVSYGLYILHYMFVFLLGAVVQRIEQRFAIPVIARSFLMIAAGGLLAYSAAELSWRMFEKPILGLKRYCRYRYQAPVSDAG